MQIFEEFNPFRRKYKKGLRRVALVYPNRYVGGIANIGLQYIYAKANEVAICERFYTDAFGGLRSVESATPLKEFDIALFSLQYEMDYFKAVEIIKKSGFSGIKIAGGPCVMENPKPVKKYFDAFFIGEAEDVIEELVLAKDKEELKGIKGVYTGEEDKVKRVCSKLKKHLETEIIGEGAYGKCFLIEIGRGCIRRCRFCIVRRIYFPPRWRKPDDFPEVKGVNKVALIAPSPSDHPKFKDILASLIERGFEVSPSSIRADTLDEELVELLKMGNLKTLTIAPETASQRLVDVLNKGIKPEDVIRSSQIAKDFEKIKLYFMIGLPGENFEDIKNIVRLAVEVRKIVKRVEVSVNPLVPKPHTPFQWLPFSGDEDVKKGLAELRRKMQYIRKGCKKFKIEVDIGNIREFSIQTILSRGDEDVSMIFEGVHYSKFQKYLEKIDVDRELPWDFIDHGYKKKDLISEFLSVQNSLSSR